MSTFKVGDRVRVGYNSLNEDWNFSGATIGIISRIENTLTLLKLVDSNGTHFKKCSVYTSSLVSEELYNSPLYQALK